MTATAPSSPRPRPALRHLRPAEHGGPQGDAPPRVDFSSSVAAYGPAPIVVAAIREAVAPDGLAPYPDPTCRVAREALAGLTGEAPECTVVGAGAAELILAVALAYVRMGDRVLVPAHAFAEYERAAMLCGATVVPIRLADVDPSAVLAREVARHRPRLVFLCTPESPSGRAWTRDAVAVVADACARVEALLVLDQSFDAFAPAPLGTPALAGHPAVLHLRSITKDHALAGLRVGYAVASARVADAVARARMPWSVSTPAQAALTAACTPEARRHVAERAPALRAEAVALATALRAEGVRVEPSDTHYFLLHVGDGGAAARWLRERHGLRVRDCRSFGLPGHIRVAARTPAENALLVAACRGLTSAFSSMPLVSPA